jgi:hypothetical protein
VDIRIQRRSLERIEDFLCFVEIAFLFRDPQSAFPRAAAIAIANQSF